MSNIQIIQDSGKRGIDAQKKRQMQLLKAEQRNSQRLQKAMNDYLGENIQPLDLTPKLTTQEILSDMLKLRDLFRKDLKEMMQDENEINKVVAEPEFNN
jgi:hypothetical protein